MRDDEIDYVFYNASHDYEDMKKWLLQDLEEITGNLENLLINYPQLNFKVRNMLQNAESKMIEAKEIINNEKYDSN